MTQGIFEVYKIDSLGNRTLISQKKNYFFGSSFANNYDKNFDLILISDFGEVDNLKKIVDISKKINELNSIIDEDKTVIDEKKSEISDRNAQISDINNTINRLKSEINQNLNLIDTSNKTIATSEQNITNLKSDIVSLNEQLKTINTNIANEEKTKSTIEKNISDLTALIQTKNEEKTNLIATIEDITNYINNADSKTELNPDVILLRTNIATEQSNIITYNNDIQSRNLQITDLTNQRITLNNKLIQVKTDTPTDTVTITDLKNQIATIDNKISQINIEIDNLNSQIEISNNNITSYQNDILAKKYELFVDYKQKSDDLIAHNTTLTNLNAEILDLEANKKINDDGLIAITQTINKLNANKFTTENNINAKNTAINQNNENITNAQIQITTSLTQIDINKEKITAEEVKIPPIENEILELGGKIEEQKIKIGEKDTLIKEYIDKISNMNIKEKYVPFELRNMSERILYPTLESWKKRNVTLEELQIIYDSDSTKLVESRGIPNKFLYSTIQKIATDKVNEYNETIYEEKEIIAESINYSSITEITNFKFNSDVVSFINSSANGANRILQTHKLNDKIYVRPYFISKKFNVPGVYKYIATTAGDNLISLSNLIAPENQTSDNSAIILNENETLEVNYIYMFYSVIPENNLKYTFVFNNIEYTVTYTPTDSSNWDFLKIPIKNISDVMHINDIKVNAYLTYDDIIKNRTLNVNYPDSLSNYKYDKNGNIVAGSQIWYYDFEDSSKSTYINIARYDNSSHKIKFNWILKDHEQSGSKFIPWKFHSIDILYNNKKIYDVSISPQFEFPDRFKMTLPCPNMLDLYYADKPIIKNEYIGREYDFFIEMDASEILNIINTGDTNDRTVFKDIQKIG
mgnify:CR=1 FL=1